MNQRPRPAGKKPSTAERPGTLFVVGAGPGSAAHLTEEARQIISASAFIAGGPHQLRLAGNYASAAAETHTIGAVLDDTAAFISEKLKSGNVCVLTSGDPGCYSILPFLKKRFGAGIVVVPGISSVQLLAARLAVPWEAWDLVSLHGRAFDLPAAPARPTLFFCDGSNTPQAVARRLLDLQDQKQSASGSDSDETTWEPPDFEAAVGAALGRGDELVRKGSLGEISQMDLPGDSLLLVMPEPRTPAPGRMTAAAAREAPRNSGTGGAPGIPDDRWLRQEGIPLAKAEVRAVLLAKARPAGRGVIWDIGAGTGSYGIECSLLEPGAQVIAMDKNPAACHLVAANAERFGARVEIVCASAPEGFETLAAPDLVIIGGSEGMLVPIFKAAARALKPGGRLAVTALLESTKKTAHKLFAESGLENRSATRVSIARGEGHEWVEQNPVIIFTGDS